MELQHGEARVAVGFERGDECVDLFFRRLGAEADTQHARGGLFVKAHRAVDVAQLPAMTELYEKRLALRKARGAMDIESDEAKLVMDEEGRCVDIVKRTRGVSECMIEEFMLLANQCAAHFARVKQIPFVYRVHEEPNAEKLELSLIHI